LEFPKGLGASELDFEGGLHDHGITMPKKKKTSTKFPVIFLTDVGCTSLIGFEGAKIMTKVYAKLWKTLEISISIFDKSTFLNMC
jgi:hypothetical protein